MRLAIFCRRFWPYCDEEETEVADLARFLIDAGHHVQLLTIQWSKEWPLHFEYQEIPVHRFPQRWSGPWGIFRFSKELEQYIQSLNLDGLIVFGLGQESWVVLKSMCRRMPVVGRVNLRQIQGLSKGVFRRPLIRIPSQIRKILVDSSLTKEILQKMHGPDQTPSIQIVSPITRTRHNSSVSQPSRATIRNQLTEAHPVLAIEGRGPLVVINSHFDQPILIDLIQNWRLVLDHFPESKLWMIGDGINAKRVWERICDAELADSIVMPGYFDHVDDVILAADLCVGLLNNDQQAVSPFLLKVMAYQVPLILHRHAVESELIRLNSHTATAGGLTAAPLQTAEPSSNPTASVPGAVRSFGMGRELAEAIRTSLSRGSDLSLANSTDLNQDLLPSQMPHPAWEADSRFLFPNIDQQVAQFIDALSGPA